MRCTILCLLAVALLSLGSRWLSPGRAGPHDRLSDEDRKALADRFEKEVWPLMNRGGKDSCLSCHRDRKVLSALRLSGDPQKDFDMLIRDGFFLPDDEGSLLGMVTHKDPTLRMPPAPRKGLSAEDIKVLRDFTAEVNRRQRK
jgi:hypothetical protein